MKLKTLKKIRVIVSLAFFLAMGLIFLDITFSIPAIVYDAVVYFQFVPSLLKFLTVATLSASGFIIVIGLTLFFGRVYCSFLCPLGVLQDVLTCTRKTIRGIRFTYHKPHTVTRTAILTVVILAIMSGSIIGLTVLDPYSNFGRIVTQIVRPIVIGMNNTLAFALAKVNLYAVDPVEFKGLALFPFLFGVGIFGVVFWMSQQHGRLYCNTICPVGTLLGFLSRYSFLKIRFKAARCIRCKACEYVCKSGCIDVANESIDFSRCVACYNCFQACPTAGIGYHVRFRRNEQVGPEDTDKRKFILQTAAFLLIAGSSARAAERPNPVYEGSTVPVIRKTAVSPPGALSLKHFMNTCTACHLCVAACPTQVLQSSFLEYGLSGIMKPRMDYSASFCNYDCVFCSTVCPSGALVQQSPESKKLIQLGKARFIEKNCIVYTRKTDCGACAEHCPTKAVRMVLDETINKRAPKIDETRCVGCGACEFACPTRPYKSIYVQGNPVHLVAQKPKEEKIEEKVNVTHAFPF
jgi:ferredoxin